MHVLAGLRDLLLGCVMELVGLQEPGIYP